MGLENPFQMLWLMCKLFLHISESIVRRLLSDFNNEYILLKNETLNLQLIHNLEQMSASQLETIKNTLIDSYWKLNINCRQIYQGVDFCPPFMNLLLNLIQNTYENALPTLIH